MRDKNADLRFKIADLNCGFKKNRRQRAAGRSQKKTRN
jgi:hypothetical protein